MLNRREFLQVAAAGGATLAVSSFDAITAEPVGGGSDGHSAARVLSDHRVAKVESTRCRTAFPGRSDPTAKGTRLAAEAAIKFR